MAIFQIANMDARQKFFREIDVFDLMRCLVRTFCNFLAHYVGVDFIYIGPTPPSLNIVINSDKN